MANDATHLALRHLVLEQRLEQPQPWPALLFGLGAQIGRQLLHSRQPQLGEHQGKSTLCRHPMPGNRDRRAARTERAYATAATAGDPHAAGRVELPGLDQYDMSYSSSLASCAS
jgi:hypothetical protein